MQVANCLHEAFRLGKCVMLAFVSPEMLAVLRQNFQKILRGALNYLKIWKGYISNFSATAFRSYWGDFELTKWHLPFDYYDYDYYYLYCYD